MPNPKDKLIIELRRRVKLLEDGCKAAEYLLMAATGPDPDDRRVNWEWDEVRDGWLRIFGGRH